jgi:hypothetical protein
MTNNIGISIGYNCNSAIWGVRNNIRNVKKNGYKTCPFDMMISNYNGLCECLKDDFKYLCDENYLELIKRSETEYIIYNNKYNFSFNHESPGHANLYISGKWELGTNHFVLNNYENLKKRYSHRIENFRNYLLDENNTINFILTTWEKTEDDLQDLKNILVEKYPKLKYKFILLNNPLGKDNFIHHVRSMRYTENDNELKRLL